MEKNRPIEVKQAQNGFIVREAPNRFTDSGIDTSEEAYVFESFDGLSAWMSSHFTHRAEDIDTEETRENFKEKYSR